MKSKIIAKKNLSRDIWNDDNTINPIVRKALLKIVFDFLSSIDLNGLKIKDVVIVGSLTGFFWSKKSDLDVHIIYDPRDNNIDPKIANILFKTLAQKWNFNHEVFIKGHPVELYMQSNTEKNISPGVYSLIYNKWIVIPSKSSLMFSKPELEKFKQKIKTWIDIIKKAIKSKNPEKIKNVLLKLKENRKEGLNKAGEFSIENLIFKYLRNHGWILKLKKAYQKIYNKKVSVQELFDAQSSAGPNTGPFPNGIPYYKYIIQKMKGISSGKVNPEINVISSFLKENFNDINLPDVILLRCFLKKMKTLNSDINDKTLQLNSILKFVNYVIKYKLSLLEGWGSINPKDDILSIPGKRWTIRYKYDSYIGKQKNK